ncbi:anthrax toxin-like adenylyl cyclase domain-containing protein [Acanthopleuribacter pedis]|uniref:Anthrax toxin edema factor central domain-containing protein n=1 Tax=Acanthopleuribacter pedis TaxID=442870 RepID=A0A8J7QFV7_9BACT|nr:anthrax toxin-like adenylyl cyclase domain-containing protein [Acanthopleuribacter pedis]MBO1323374.1 hypothetical protein [Acanthopleuribacter pedis]
MSGLSSIFNAIRGRSNRTRQPVAPGAVRQPRRVYPGRAQGPGQPPVGPNLQGAAPRQMQVAAAAQTNHGAPAQTNHGAPAQTNHGAPAQTNQGAPLQTNHGAPAQTNHAATLNTRFNTTHFTAEMTRQTTQGMMDFIADKTLNVDQAKTIVKMGPAEFADWQESGITLKHWQDFKAVAKGKAFLFVRPVNTLSTTLIDEGFGTKGMDIKGKSADWGPQAGFIPVDQNLSKLAGKAAEVVKYRGKLDQSLDANGSPVAAAPLRLSENRLNELISLKILPENFEPGKPFTTQDPQNPAKERTFLIEKQAGGFEVMVAPPGKGAAEAKAGDFEPLMVVGYSDGGNVNPVTADYDLFAACPDRKWAERSFSHLKKGDPNENVAPPTTDLGGVTPWDKHFIEECNQKMTGDTPRVVHHGPETSNPDPQMDDFVLMFTSSGNARRVEIDDLPDIWHDMAQGRHILESNPKWEEHHPGLRHETRSEISARSQFGKAGLSVLNESDFAEETKFLNRKESELSLGEKYHVRQMGAKEALAQAKATAQTKTAKPAEAAGAVKDV